MAMSNGRTGRAHARRMTPVETRAGQPAQRREQSTALSRSPRRLRPSIAPPSCASNTRRGFMESIIHCQGELL
jgi:hypothetical protein